MGAAREKGADEIFCRSCGEVIKRAAEICPHCGVRNQEASASSSSGSTSSASRPTHDPGQYSTTVSDSWWYGVAGATGLWILVFVLSGVAGDSIGAFGGFVAMIAWAGLPAAAYFDMQYVRANSDWNPSTGLWVLLLLVWFVNVVAGAVYLYRRHEVLGEP